MEDEEFEVLDELYFVTPYKELQDKVDLSPSNLHKTLRILVKKGWVRVYDNKDNEIEDPDLVSNPFAYLYLASKKGLLAHNRQ